MSKLHAIRVGPAPKFEPIPGTEFTLDADLVLLAMGFTGPVKGGLLEQLGVDAGRARQCRDRCKLHDRRHRASSRRATARAASRWWCGPSPKAAKPPRASITT